MLPTELTKKNFTLDSSMILLYGAPKTGKTTLACGSGKALLLHTPGCGHNVVSAFKVEIDSFEKVIEVLHELRKQKGKLPYTAVVVDLLSDLQVMAGRSIVRKYNEAKRGSITDLAEMPNGLGWSRLKGAVLHVLDLLADLGVPVVLVCHEKMREFSEGVMKRSKWANNLTGSMANDVPGRCDLIGRVVVNKGDRIVLVNPTDKSEAGNRYGFQEPYVKAEWAELEKLARGGAE